MTGALGGVSPLPSRPMDMDAILTLASLGSFFALIVTWIAAPLRATEPRPASEATEPVPA